MNNLFSVIQKEIESDILQKEIVIPIPQLLEWSIVHPTTEKIIVLIYRFETKSENGQYKYTFSGASIK